MNNVFEVDHRVLPQFIKNEFSKRKNKTFREIFKTPQKGNFEMVQSASSSKLSQVEKSKEESLPFDQVFQNTNTMIESDSEFPDYHRDLNDIMETIANDCEFRTEQ